MKKLMLFMMMIAAFASVSVSSVLAADYSDAIKVQEKFIAAMENYVQKMETVQSSSGVVSALNSYTDRINKIAPQMKAMMEKYPELKNSDKIPEPFKPLSVRAKKVAEEMGMAMMKAMPHMQNPAVQAAQQRMAAAMAKMGQME